VKTFEKFDSSLMNNKVLSANEKVVYIICKSFATAPRGCRISHKYLMDRTKIKTRKTLIKCLDRLTMFGMLARKQIDNSTCHYVFDKATMQEYINHNINKRRRIALGKQKSSPQINPQNNNVINIVRKGK
jgi:hypothetical protein|tara:strand:- start:95 stop:484 length:390 start_codon:yes stop_codon:yes gene_type:complete